MIRVAVTVTERSSDSPDEERTVARREITYYESQPYTVKIDTPDGPDWVQELIAGGAA